MMLPGMVLRVESTWKRGWQDEFSGSRVAPATWAGAPDAVTVFPQDFEIVSVRGYQPAAPGSPHDQ